jgi:hypothetical protein
VKDLGVSGPIGRLIRGRVQRDVKNELDAHRERDEREAGTGVTLVVACAVSL